ncbi:MAG: 4Fe-4S binding protein [Verrucomicrobia bacterium]|nr:4Fe-4S binding protein [Verrucomicrobiota bacterium]
MPIPQEREGQRENFFQTIHTMSERCRVCYTCVRECPAKAIRIIEGQAKVIHERCIGCGNCVRVCSQRAKVVVDSIPRVEELLQRGDPVAAIIAPSFASDFQDYPYRDLVAAIHSLGFRWVSEVAFGADLVARRYKELLAKKGEPMIATTCPAVALYVEKYFPEMVPALAPVVSPMVAMARVMRKLHGDGIRVVFIGPCTAKKGEGMDANLEDEIDAVLTFIELRQMLVQQDLHPGAVPPRDFDPPHGGSGALFPLSGGMLQAAAIEEDLIQQDVVTADGKNFSTAIKEFASGDLPTQLLEVLACQGCIMGAGTQAEAPLFRRRSRVSAYVRDRMSTCSREEWEAAIQEFKGLDLSRVFSDLDQRLEQPNQADIARILKRMGKSCDEDELNCGACGYETCREHAIAISMGLAESEMCLPYTIDQLHGTVDELAKSNSELANTQEALMQSERLASMGQLAAGIAHEVNNPLGVVLMYAHLLMDDLEEDHRLHEDAQMIAEQADRCKKIVSGLLHFARQNKVQRQPVDVQDLMRRGIRSVVVPPNVDVREEHKGDRAMVEVDADQILQVMTNLLTNAYAAMPEGGRLTVHTRVDESEFVIQVSDTGVGISHENVGKIFEPFFTTKQIGKGTGLGLAVTYGIIKMHRGQISVESNADPETGPTGTTFTVKIPCRDEEL